MGILDKYNLKQLFFVVVWSLILHSDQNISSYQNETKKKIADLNFDYEILNSSFQVDVNDDLETLMEKSKTNKLDSDGLTTLKYKKIQEKYLPLYTWILVDLPKAPPKKVKSWWDQFQNQVKDGMNYAAGGLAKKVAESAVNFAQKRDNEEEESKDHLY